MRPLHLTMCGINRFAETMDLDLRDLPPGLVAVVGANGEGKTTIMEALGPMPLWLEFPSRPGSIIDRATRRDAFVELTHEHQGRVFKHTIQIDPGTGRSGQKTEAFLEVDGEKKGNGRQTDYALEIDRYFPDRRLFMASVYAAQTGAGSFVNMDLKGRRALFATMLGSDGLQALSERAREAAKPLEAALARADGEEATLRANLALARELATRVDELARELVAAEQETAVAVGQRESAEAALAGARERDRAWVEAKRQIDARRDALHAEVAALQREVFEHGRTLESLGALIADGPRREAEAAEAQRVAADLEAARARVSERQAGVGTAQAAMDAARRASQAAARLVADLAARAARAASARARLGELAAMVRAGSEAREAREAHQEALREALALARARASAHADLNRGAPSAALARQALEHAREKSRLLSDVPCGGDMVARGPDLASALRTINDGAYHDNPTDVARARARLSQAVAVATGADCSACRFLVDARGALAAIPGLAQAVEAAEARELEIVAALASAREAEARAEQALQRDRELGQVVERGESAARESAALREAAGDEQGLREQHAVAVAEAEEAARALADREAEFAALNRQIDELIQRRNRLEARAHELVAAPAELAALHRAREREPELVAARARAVERAATLTAEADALACPPREPLFPFENAVEVARAGERVAREGEAGAREALAGVRARREALGDPTARLGALAAWRARVASRRAGFRLVEASMGRTGIQALEIDAAGPHVSQLTGSLLEACYGPRFAVVLRTVQEASARHTQREVFDLMVLDADRGGARTVGELSGGEQVIVDEALKLALALFNASRWGVQVSSLWRDECDGRLDPDNAARYPAMLRRAQGIGGWRNVFFVSHRPDVFAQADAVIRVAGGRAFLEV